MSSSQQKYLQEYEKYKHNQITEGCEYTLVKNPVAIYKVVSVDNANEKVVLMNKSGFILNKTLHWCRKNLLQLWGQ